MKTLVSLLLACGVTFGQIPTPMGSTWQGGASCTMPSTTGFSAVWEADLGLTCTGGCSGGNPVTSVADESVNANTLTAGSAGTYQANQINGKPAVLLNGTSNYYTGATAITPGGSVTIFFVGKMTSTASKGVITSDSSTNGTFAYYFPYSASNLQGADEDLTAAIGGGTATPDTSWHQTNVVWTNGVSAVFRKDRAADGTVSSAVSISNPGGEIGKDVTSGIQWGNYEWYLIAVYNGAASGTIVSDWETYAHCQTGL